MPGFGCLALTGWGALRERTMAKQKRKSHKGENKGRSGKSGDIGRMTAVAVFASFAAEVSQANSEHWTVNPDPGLPVAPWAEDVEEAYVFTLPPPPPPPCAWDFGNDSDDSGDSDDSSDGWDPATCDSCFSCSDTDTTYDDPVGGP